MLNSEQITHGFVHLGLEHFQGQRFPSLFGQPVPMLKYPHNKKYFPYIQLEPSLRQFIALVSPSPLVKSRFRLLSKLFLDVGRLLLGPS